MRRLGGLRRAGGSVCGSGATVSAAPAAATATATASAFTRLTFAGRCLGAIGWRLFADREGVVGAIKLCIVATFVVGGRFDGVRGKGFVTVIAHGSDDGFRIGVGAVTAGSGGSVPMPRRIRSLGLRASIGRVGGRATFGARRGCGTVGRTVPSAASTTATTAAAAATTLACFSFTGLPVGGR